jgi:hypothetical protein
MPPFLVENVEAQYCRPHQERFDAAPKSLDFR